MNIETQPFGVTGRLQISGNDVQVFFNSTQPASYKCKLDKKPAVTCKCN